MRLLPPLLCLVAVVLGALSCGPIVSGVQVINADVALTAAKNADADTLARYEYVAAEQYLHKAREELGYSDFAGARRFADEALRYAVKARRRAETTAPK